MNQEKKSRKFSLLIRLLGASCTLLLTCTAIYIALAGLNFASGFIAAVALTGLVGPGLGLRSVETHLAAKVDGERVSGERPKMACAYNFDVSLSIGFMPKTFAGKGIASFFRNSRQSFPVSLI